MSNVLVFTFAQIGSTYSNIFGTTRTRTTPMARPRVCTSPYPCLVPTSTCHRARRPLPPQCPLSVNFKENTHCLRNNISVLVFYCRLKRGYEFVCIVHISRVFYPEWQNYTAPERVPILCPAIKHRNRFLFIWFILL